MRDSVRLAVLIAALVLLLVSWAALTAANTHSSQQTVSVAKAGAVHGAAKGSGAANTCELCQKPITAGSEATLENPADGSVQLNRTTLALGPADQFPSLTGEATPAGTIIAAPATINFLIVANANNPNCR